MKRNIIHIFWAATVLPMLLFSCRQEELPGMTSADGAQTLSITIADDGYHVSADGKAKSQSPIQAQTRTEENGYVTEFATGDACGLYIVRNGVIVYENVKLTATKDENSGLAWQSEKGITLAGGLSDEHYFLYYPYQATESMSGKTDVSATDDAGFFAPLIEGWQPAADQSAYAGYTASDLMTATGTATGTDGKLSLSFPMNHRMALAVIVVPGKRTYIFTGSSIPNYVVEPSTVDFASETKPYSNGDNTYRYLVNPNASSGPTLDGIYDYGKVKRELIITPVNMDAGAYKYYKVDADKPTEIEYSMQPGDYFCKNGGDEWYIIPRAEIPSVECIGIVFYVGKNEYDLSDYSKSGIGQGDFHGYVVALTDVHNDKSDRLSWVVASNGEHGFHVGNSISGTDWSGYDNYLKVLEYVNRDNLDDWDMKRFPAFLACDTYGNRTLDQNGEETSDYDWQRPLAAPAKTSGWFLPAIGQLSCLRDSHFLISGCITDVKNSTPDDCTYKEYIKWFDSVRYWSSTEHKENYFASCVYFTYPGVYQSTKTDSQGVRAVLAF